SAPTGFLQSRQAESSHHQQPPYPQRSAYAAPAPAGRARHGNGRSAGTYGGGNGRKLSGSPRGFNPAVELNTAQWCPGVVCSGPLRQRRSPRKIPNLSVAENPHSMRLFITFTLDTTRVRAYYLGSSHKFCYNTRPWW